jgi:hypothetical protein
MSRKHFEFWDLEINLELQTFDHHSYQIKKS